MSEPIEFPNEFIYKLSIFYFLITYLLFDDPNPPINIPNVIPMSKPIETLFINNPTTSPRTMAMIMVVFLLLRRLLFCGSC